MRVGGDPGFKAQTVFVNGQPYEDACRQDSQYCQTYDQGLDKTRATPLPPGQKFLNGLVFG
jgi:hypothetical protein